MTIPPVVAVTVPIAVPIPRMPREDVFLPVTAQTVVSIPVVVCVLNIVSNPNSVSIANVASIADVGSGISLVPHACDRGTSMVRDAMPLIDSYSGEWTRTGNRCSILIDRMLPEGSGSG